MVETPFGPFPASEIKDPDTYQAEWRELLIEFIASELSAKDGEIERLKLESNERHDLLSKERRANDSVRHQLSIAEALVERLAKRRFELRAELTTARADAIKECVDKIGEVRNQWLARLPNSDDPTFKHHYQVCADAGAVITTALKFLLNEKEHGNNASATGADLDGR
jgi:hypothetical protein